jgi:hypothetical protein
MGPRHPSNSTRPRKARSGNSVPKPRRKPVSPQPAKLRTTGEVTHDDASDRVPADIEIALHEERGSLITAISILYGLHSILRRERDGDESEISEALEDAAKWSNSVELSGMTLVKLHAVLKKLDAIALGKTNVDPDEVALAEAARQLAHEGGTV